MPQVVVTKILIAGLLWLFMTASTGMSWYQMEDNISENIIEDLDELVDEYEFYLERFAKEWTKNNKSQITEDIYEHGKITNETHNEMIGDYTDSFNNNLEDMNLEIEDDTIDFMRNKLFETEFTSTFRSDEYIIHKYIEKFIKSSYKLK